MAKQASNQAYVRAKRDMEEAELRAQNGEPPIDTSDKDVFEVQHHHLLNCLEKTTVAKSPVFSIKCMIEKYTQYLVLVKWWPILR